MTLLYACSDDETALVELTPVVPMPEGEHIGVLPDVPKVELPVVTWPKDADSAQFKRLFGELKLAFPSLKTDVVYYRSSDAESKVGKGGQSDLSEVVIWNAGEDSPRGVVLFNASTELFEYFPVPYLLLVAGFRDPDVEDGWIIAATTAILDQLDSESMEYAVLLSYFLDRASEQHELDGRGRSCGAMTKRCVSWCQKGIARGGNHEGIVSYGKSLRECTGQESRVTRCWYSPSSFGCPGGGGGTYTGSSGGGSGGGSGTGSVPRPPSNPPTNPGTIGSEPTNLYDHFLRNTLKLDDPCVDQLMEEQSVFLTGMIAAAGSAGDSYLTKCGSSPAVTALEAVRKVAEDLCRTRRRARAGKFERELRARYPIRVDRKAGEGIACLAQNVPLAMNSAFCTSENGNVLASIQFGINSAEAGVTSLSNGEFSNLVAGKQVAISITIDPSLIIPSSSYVANPAFEVIQHEMFHYAIFDRAAAAIRSRNPRGLNTVEEQLSWYYRTLPDIFEVDGVYDQHFGYVDLFLDSYIDGFEAFGGPSKEGLGADQYKNLFLFSLLPDFESIASKSPGLSRRDIVRSFGVTENDLLRTAVAFRNRYGSRIQAAVANTIRDCD